MTEIDRDLVRWKRSQWVAVIGVLFAAQLAAIILASHNAEETQSVYRKEPVVALAETARRAAPEEFDNPFLFASANRHGFSGDAWLQKEEWKAPETGRAVPRRFLSFAEAQKTATDPYVGSLALVQRTGPPAAFPKPAETPRIERKSQLRVEGLAGRGLMNAMSLPVQHHNDTLRETVVQALVGPDGLVISAHLAENSGSARADADALALARAARFSPLRGTNRAPELGKLIFQWHALDLSATNTVSNAGSNQVVRPR